MYHDIDDIDDKYKNIDVYAEDSICPICKKTMFKVRARSMSGLDCENSCYSIGNYYIRDEKHTVIVIFNSSMVEITDEDYINGSNFFKEIEIAKDIYYWIENDRYLAKILTQ